MSNNDSICHLLEFPTFPETDGSLSYIEGQNHIPFLINRIFYIYDIPPKASRGAHAHKTNHEILIALTGNFEVFLDEGDKKYSFILNKPYMGLYIPPMVWVELIKFSPGAICMVLNSEAYNADDNIYTRKKFLQHRKQIAS